ncbi:TPA: TatD family hydrolase [Staphylococcus aureus]|nr:TatD family hydrolase [Staphylococcus aureus]
MLIDTHVHLNDEQYDDDLSEVITRAREAGVDRMFVVGFNKSTIERAMKLIDEYDFLYGIIGWHPVDAIDFTEEHLEWIESLAQRLKLPIIIHNREATQDCIDILLEEHAEEVGGIMHSFSGSPEIADIVTNKLNFYISLGGPVTFKNAKQPKEVAKHVSMERLLVETDAPYLSPHPYRGKRNEPARVTLVAEQIAELKGLSYEEVCEQTTKNAEKLFNLNS